jgi:hypothetical protein
MMMMMMMTMMMDSLLCRECLDDKLIPSTLDLIFRTVCLFSLTVCN